MEKVQTIVTLEGVVSKILNSKFVENQCKQVKELKKVHFSTYKNYSIP